MTDDSSRAAWLSEARSYLRNTDPVLARLIGERPDFDPRAWISQLPPMDLFGALLFQVAGQQPGFIATGRRIELTPEYLGADLRGPGGQRGPGLDEPLPDPGLARFVRGGQLLRDAQHTR